MLDMSIHNSKRSPSQDSPGKDAPEPVPGKQDAGEGRMRTGGIEKPVRARRTAEKPEDGRRKQLG